MVGRAKKVAAGLKKYKTLLYMHFLLDILDAAARLSLSFQKDQTSLTTTKDALATFIFTIEGLKHNNGENLQQFLDAVGDGRN